MTDATNARRNVAVVTGANRGIGWEIARTLADRDVTVLLGCRDLERGHDAAGRLNAEGRDVRPLELDVTAPDSIARAAAAVEREFGRLDILTNNAGVLLDDAPPSKLGVDVLRRTYETNVFGLFAVTRAFLPLLRRSSNGCVVNVSSGLASFAKTTNPDIAIHLPNWLAYNSSKSAVNAMTVQLAFELRATGIKVNAVDPGQVATGLSGGRGNRTAADAAAVVAQYALLPADGPTGTFMDAHGPESW